MYGDDVTETVIALSLAIGLAAEQTVVIGLLQGHSLAIKEPSSEKICIFLQSKKSSLFAFNLK